MFPCFKLTISTCSSSEGEVPDVGTAGCQAEAIEKTASVIFLAVHSDFKANGISKHNF
jgi:hypothetical protein